MGRGSRIQGKDENAVAVGSQGRLKGSLKNSLKQAENCAVSLETSHCQSLNTSFCPVPYPPAQQRSSRHAVESRRRHRGGPSTEKPGVLRFFPSTGGCVYIFSLIPCDTYSRKANQSWEWPGTLDTVQA